MRVRPRGEELDLERAWFDVRHDLHRRPPLVVELHALGEQLREREGLHLVDAAGRLVQGGEPHHHGAERCVEAIDAPLAHQVHCRCLGKLPERSPSDGRHHEGLAEGGPAGALAVPAELEAWRAGDLGHVPADALGRPRPVREHPREVPAGVPAELEDDAHAAAEPLQDRAAAPWQASAGGPRAAGHHQDRPGLGPRAGPSELGAARHRAVERLHEPPRPPAAPGARLRLQFVHAATRQLR
mmetsp:Transcript_46504/g.141143  ORF Transcript_46504/g.141143 Transcript_46504/m.141143 type:complete len:241 (-) Transcript_46504:4066-4788(-)